MLKVISQDGKAKCEITNYEVISASPKTPGASRIGGSSYYIFTPDCGGKYLAIYHSESAALKIFQQMLHLEAVHSEELFQLPEED